MDKHQYAQNINTYITDYIKFADAKGAAILSAIGLISTGVYYLTDAFLKDVGILKCGKIFFVVVGLTIVFFSLFLAIKALMDVFKTFKPNITKSTDSLNSFPNITQFDSVEKYVSKLKALDADDIYVELSKHNWELSSICSNKYTHVGSAISYFKNFVGCSALFLIWYLVVKTIVFFQG